MKMSRGNRIWMDWACEDIQYQLFDYDKNCNRINRRPFTREELVEAAKDWWLKEGKRNNFQPPIFTPLQLVSELISNKHWEIEIEEKEMESVSDKPSESNQPLQ